MLEFKRIDEPNKIYDCNIPKGDTGEIPVTIEGYDLANGDRIQFKMGKNLDYPLITKNYTTFIDNGCIILIQGFDTENLEAGIYYYVAKLIKANGETDTFIEKSIFEVEEA
jgi:hypothetical protein